MAKPAVADVVDKPAAVDVAASSAGPALAVDVAVVSPAKRKHPADQGDGGGEATDDGDGGGGTETHAAKAQRTSLSRKNRSTKIADRWSRQDDRMQPYLDKPPLKIDLHRPTTRFEFALVAKMSALWVYLEEQGVFLPRYHNATWQNMPVEAKVFSFLAMRERGILLNVDQFNVKAQARLCKLRQQRRHVDFRADPHHRAVVHVLGAYLWTSYREGEADEEPVEAEGSASQVMLDTANAELVALRAQLRAATKPQPNSPRKLLFSLPLLMIVIIIIPA